MGIKLLLPRWGCTALPLVSGDFPGPTIAQNKHQRRKSCTARGRENQFEADLAGARRGIRATPGGLAPARAAVTIRIMRANAEPRSSVGVDSN